MPVKITPNQNKPDYFDIGIYQKGIIPNDAGATLLSTKTFSNDRKDVINTLINLFEKHVFFEHYRWHVVIDENNKEYWGFSHKNVVDENSTQFNRKKNNIWLLDHPPTNGITVKNVTENQ